MGQKKWTGTWRFDNGGSEFHGLQGTKTVQAQNEDMARDVIQRRVSCTLFGDAKMRESVEVSWKETP